tara:strand:- start:395 stop:772 length:378 start_codon:yes stop_codon:yes gene_type:complete
MNWRQENQALEDAYARRLLVEYNIREVTTQRQAKNGTREFEFPVKTKWKKEPLRLACFKSGYVRKQNDTSSPYQLNKTYKQNVRWTLLTENGLETKEYISIARAKIWSGLARMNYMLEYYLKNWK